MTSPFPLTTVHTFSREIISLEFQIMKNSLPLLHLYLDQHGIKFKIYIHEISYSLVALVAPFVVIWS